MTQIHIPSLKHDGAADIRHLRHEVDDAGTPTGEHTVVSPESVALTLGGKKVALSRIDRLHHGEEAILRGETTFEGRRYVAEKLVIGSDLLTEDVPVYMEYWAAPKVDETEPPKSQIEPDESEGLPWIEGTA